MKLVHLKKMQSFILPFAVLGIFLGWLDIQIVNSISSVITEIFVKILKLISLPIIFLSITSTLGGANNPLEVKVLGVRVLRYTLLTTLAASAVALSLYVFFDPASGINNLAFNSSASEVIPVTNQGSYWSFLLKSIPENIVDPFLKNNVLGILFLAILLSFSMLSLEEHHKKPLQDFVQACFAVLLKIATFVMLFMPIVVPAFMVLFFQEMKSGLQLNNLLLYLVCIVGANIFQATVVLPCFLLLKGHKPLHLLKAMWPALTVAFFAKSSTASLPTALKCAVENGKISKKVANFSLPLCATINMNACAGFILITVLFVSTINGVTFSNWELVSWIFIATIAAIGNAAVPMGCYFLASSFLAAQDIPLHFMGAILPLYALLDMLETAINVWSDSCVTAVVDKEITY